MDQLLTNSKPLLPGFRFHPTDEELFVYYLKRKCMGKSLSPQMMSEVDVYQFPPWDLPEKSWMKTRDLSWYFFCPRSKKYARGARTNRSTEHGYWKSTGNDRTVNYKNRPVGKIKTLIFHLGKAPKGDRTDWVMHEYRLEDKSLADQGVFQDLYAICKVYKKSGQGPKNGENYGAPFVEEDWETDDDDDESLQTSVRIPLANEGETQSVSAVTNTLPNHDCATAPIIPINDGSFLLGNTPITPMMNDGSFLLDIPPITPMNDGSCSFLLDTPPITPMNDDGSCSFLQDIDPMKIIEGDELEKMLAMFTEEDIDTPIVGNEMIAKEHNDTPPVVGTKNVNVMVDNNVYHGLVGDLAQADQMGFSWSQLAGEIGKDYCIHLDDLAGIF